MLKKIIGIICLISMNLATGDELPLTEKLAISPKKIEIRKNNKNINDPVEQFVELKNNAKDYVYVKLIFQESSYEKGQANLPALQKNLKGNVPSLLPYIEYDNKEYRIAAKGKIRIPIRIKNQAKIIGTHFVHYYAKVLDKRDNYVEPNKSKAVSAFDLEVRCSMTFTNIETGTYQLDLDAFYVTKLKRVVFKVKNSGTNAITNPYLIPLILDEQGKIKEKLKIQNLDAIVFNPQREKLYYTDFFATKFTNKNKIKLLLVSEIDGINKNIEITDIKIVENEKELAKILKKMKK